MKKEAALEVAVKSNETVYLEMVILNGTFRGRGRLIPVGQEEAKTAVLKLKPMDGKQATDTSTASTPTQEPAPADAQAEPREPHAESDVPTQLANVTPSTIQLSVGEHLISVQKDGLRPWERTMTVTAGGSVTLDATLEKP